MGVLLKGLAVPQLQRLRVKLPHDDSHVLGARCELEAVGRELAVPDFFTVVVEHLEWRVFYLLWPSTSQHCFSFLSEIAFKINFFLP